MFSSLEMINAITIASFRNTPYQPISYSLLVSWRVCLYIHHFHAVFGSERVCDFRRFCSTEHWFSFLHIFPNFRVTADIVRKVIISLTNIYLRLIMSLTISDSFFICKYSKFRRYLEFCPIGRRVWGGSMMGSAELVRLNTGTAMPGRLRHTALWQIISFHLANITCSLICSDIL